MSLNPIAAFPDGWTIDVILLRSGGRDKKGNPQPEVETLVPGCLVGWRSTTDPVDRSDLTADRAVLLVPVGSPAIQSTDRFKIPSNTIGPDGIWSVDGKAKPWPMGTEVPLSRG